jgi:hypothetical protein
LVTTLELQGIGEGQGRAGDNHLAFDETHGRRNLMHLGIHEGSVLG